MYLQHGLTTRQPQAKSSLAMANKRKISNKITQNTSNKNRQKKHQKIL
jgi:hypothetical protein